MLEISFWKKNLKVGQNKAKADYDYETQSLNL